jgi:hypothetical protein
MVTTSRRENRASTQGPKITELQLHRSVAELLDYVLMQPVVWTTFPAGWGKLGKATAGQLYAAGLKRGLPDILIWTIRGNKKYDYKDPVCIGLELKVGKNIASPAQHELFNALREVGVDVYLCRSIDDVIDALDDAGIPRRGLVTHPRRNTDVHLKSKRVDYLTRDRGIDFSSGIPGDGK